VKSDDTALRDAKRKRESFAKMLARRPGCIYCAGTAVADTIEHMPPIPMRQDGGFTLFVPEIFRPHTP
jgi:hypothetical protein